MKTPIISNFKKNNWCWTLPNLPKKLMDLIERENSFKTHFNRHNLDASIVQHDFVNYEDY